MYIYIYICSNTTARLLTYVTYLSDATGLTHSYVIQLFPYYYSVT